MFMHACFLLGSFNAKTKSEQRENHKKSSSNFKKALHL